MAILGSAIIVAAQMWPQHDIRDPLGVWGNRVTVTGDATAGTIKIVFNVPAELAGAHVYTCYSAIAVQLSGAFTSIAAKCRLLTNWPNIDIDPGVQGYATARGVSLQTGAGPFTAPLAVPLEPMVAPNERFILLFDPRSQAGETPLVELEWGENILNSEYSFECYGYYWDREVMNAPGGPRHPGSS